MTTTLINGKHFPMGRCVPCGGNSWTFYKNLRADLAMLRAAQEAENKAHPPRRVRRKRTP